MTLQRVPAWPARYGPAFFARIVSSPYSVALPELADTLSMTDFADRKCKPCEGGVAPLTGRQAEAALRALHEDWRLGEDGKSIARQFDFPAFSRTIAFTNAVAWIATTEGHHPEMAVSYGRCVVSYKTTAIDGLSDNDFICAAKIDRITADA